METCPECHGSGRIEVTIYRDCFGYEVKFNIECPKCQGSGETEEKEKQEG